MDFDAEVREAVYDHIVRTASAPTVTDVAARLLTPPTMVREAYQRLYERRVLVLGADGETIIMAPPFSGVPTQHRVRVGDREYFANCSWDSFGIAAALHQDAVVTSRCEQTRTPLELHITETGPDAAGWVAHFAVPAARWWEDIVFT